MVWPTMSGMIVDRRDHVLMTRFSFLELRSSTFFSRCSSTNGPFFKLRGIGYLRAPRERRRLTINFWDGLSFLRVRPSGLPHGLTGCRPPDDLPSPPPSGWSTGFMATPRTVGRLPFQRIRPALPQLMLDCSALPTSPTVARQRRSTLRISPDGMRSWACGPSLATSCTLAPAERAIFAPPPGRSSTAWITVPTGMLRNGRLLPGLMSLDGPDSTKSPWESLFGAMM